MTTPSSSHHPVQRRTRIKRILGPSVVLLAAGAIMIGTMGPGSGTDTATNTSPLTPASASPAPVGQETAPAPAASQPAAPAPAPAAPAAPAPVTGADVPALAIDNAQITVPVKTTVAEFITKGSQISTDKIAAPVPGTPRPPAPDVDFTAVAHGSALGELEAKNQEFAFNGWQQSGTVQVVGTASTTTSIKDGAEQVSVTVCIDSSTVSVVDNTGATVLAADKPGTRKNLNTYIAQEVSGVWLVVEHTFPGDTSC